METTAKHTINIIPFSQPIEELEFKFIKEKTRGYSPLKNWEFPESITEFLNEEEIKNTKSLYCDFKTDSAAPITLKINLTQSKHFADNYYKHLIYKYFEPIADITRYNFIFDIEVCLKCESQPNESFDIYDKVCLRVQHNRVTNGHELLVYYSGKIAISTQSVSQLEDISTSLFNHVLFRKRLYKYEVLPDEAMYNLNEVFPHVNLALRPHFGLIVKPNPKENRYTKIKSIIDDFYTNYLNNNDFKQIIPISENGFHQLEDVKILKTTLSSNFLSFGQNKNGITPKYDLPKHGPYKLPKEPGKKAIHFFYVIKDDEREKGLEFIEYINGNKKGFQGLQEYIKVPFTLEKEFSVRFKNESNPIPEIEEQLSNKAWNPEITYFALYLSPISKLDIDPEKHEVYYRVKELLLKHGISSQVIDRSKIGTTGYHYSLANIAVAILAKLNGIPWRLDCETKNELIIGVGAFMNREIGVRYIGSSFCFSNDGNFNEFSCYSANESYLLAGHIEKAIKSYLKTNAKIERLVIHYYKTMNKKDQKNISAMLFNLKLSIPVYIVSIQKTESEDFLLFDTTFSDLMPYSGTITNIGNNQYILCNNTRYSSTTSTKIESYHLPVKLAINASDSALLTEERVQELIDQVYQFSRMYWKSLKQQSLPVTITYPEMVAEMFPHFKTQAIPEFGLKNLWFL